MTVRPIRTGEHALVASWLAKEENNQWLDFGGGRRRVEEVALKVMDKRDGHILRVFTDAADDPIGIVALSDVNRDVGSATLWFVLGEKEHGSRGHTGRAVRELLREGFGQTGLRSVFAWTVEINRGGRRLLEGVGFRSIGKLRSCHVIEGRAYGRLLYDLLAEEWWELDGRPQGDENPADEGEVDAPRARASTPGVS